MYIRDITDDKMSPSQEFRNIFPKSAQLRWRAIAGDPCFALHFDKVFAFLMLVVLLLAIYVRHSSAVLAFDVPWRIYACRRCCLFAPPALWPYALSYAIFVVALLQLMRWHLYICPFMRICTHLTATLVTFGRVWLLHLVHKRYAN